MYKAIFLQSPSVRSLIVTACTSRKKFAPPDQLTEADLDEPTSRQHSEARLASYRLPCVEMYTGTSHNFVIDAIKMLRDNGYFVDNVLQLPL